MMKSMGRILGFSAAAVIIPFALMGSYLSATGGGNPHSEVALFFLAIGTGIGCICLWALPFRSGTKIALVLPYIAVVGGGAFFFSFWFLAHLSGTAP